MGTQKITRLQWNYAKNHDMIPTIKNKSIRSNDRVSCSHVKGKYPNNIHLRM